MKTLACRRLVAMAVGCLAVGVTAHAQAGDKDECSNATLHGGYVLAATNYIGPLVVLNKLTLDGKGTFTGSANVSVNGTIISDLPNTGTYSIASDCTGTLTVDYPGFTAHFSLVLLDRGREAELVDTDAGTVAAGTLKPTPEVH
jgi:hypothetical protein